MCLRSGLRPSLRHTTRTVPQLSHKHWYKNWGGVTANFRIADLLSEVLNAIMDSMDAQADLNTWALN